VFWKDVRAPKLAFKQTDAAVPTTRLLHRSEALDPSIPTFKDETLLPMIDDLELILHDELI